LLAGRKAGARFAPQPAGDAGLWVAHGTTYPPKHTPTPTHRHHRHNRPQASSPSARCCLHWALLLPAPPPPQPAGAGELPEGHLFRGDLPDLPEGLGRAARAAARRRLARAADLGGRPTGRGRGAGRGAVPDPPPAGPARLCAT
jgi:hypothetical protein